MSPIKDLNSGQGRKRLRLASISDDVKPCVTPKKTSFLFGGEDVSPGKRVSFNIAHIPATPKRVGYHARGILKTPSKDTPKKGSLFSPMKSTSKNTPSKITWVSLTPRKSPGRRLDRLSSSARVIDLSSANTPEKAQPKCQNSPILTSSMKNMTEKLITPEKLEINFPTSPIISSSKKSQVNKNRTSSDPDLTGFSTPSPRLFNQLHSLAEVKLTSLIMSDSEESINLDSVHQHMKDFDDSSDEESFDEKVSSNIKASMEKSGTPTKVQILTNQCIEFVSPRKRNLEFDETEEDLSKLTEKSVSKSDQRQEKKKPSLPPKKKEQDVLNDDLATYFSPTSKKRQTKVRQDLQDNLAIATVIKADKRENAHRRRSRTALPILSNLEKEQKNNLNDLKNLNNKENNISASNLNPLQIPEHITEASSSSVTTAKDKSTVSKCKELADLSDEFINYFSQAQDNNRRPQRLGESYVGSASIPAVLSSDPELKFEPDLSKYDSSLSEEGDATLPNKSETKIDINDILNSDCFMQYSLNYNTVNRRSMETSKPKIKEKKIKVKTKKLETEPPSSKTLILDSFIRFKCKTCGERFRNKKTYKTHEKDCSDTEQTLECTKCIQGFQEIKQLRSHEKTCSIRKEVKPEKKPRILQCNFCNETFSSRRKHRAHTETCFVVEPSLECSKCIQGFQEIKQLRSHEKTCSIRKELKPETKSRILQCNFCNETFSSRRKHLAHTETCFVVEPMLKCVYCAEIFKDPQKLSSHEKSCSGLFPTSSSKTESLKKDISSTPRDEKRQDFSRIRSGEVSLECSVCLATFQSKRKFRAHGETCSERRLSKKRKNNSILQSEDIPWMECKYCALVFKSEMKLLSHERSCTDSFLDVSLKSRTKPSREADHSPIRKIRKDEDDSNNEFGTPSRRSGRSRVPVSYEEPIIEIDISDETSPEETLPKKKKFILASTPNPIKNDSRSSLLHRRSSTILPVISSAKQSPESNLRQSVLKLKALDDSAEMKDLTSSSGSSSDTDTSQSPNPMGKFFSIGGMEASPAGGFKLKLNRVAKPIPLNKKSSKKDQLTPSMVDYFMPRVSRSVSKDIGISPQKLAKIIIDSPKVRSYF